MRKDKVLYWVFTTPFVILTLLSVIAYLSQLPQVVGGFQHLGMPLYLLKILGTAKLLGVLAILFGGTSWMKDWAYAGFVFNFVGATASHFFSGDSLVESSAPLLLLALLLGSYSYWKKELKGSKTRA